MNLKPFDLEKALAGEPVVTRDGRPVTQLTRFDVECGQPLGGVLNGDVHLWNLDGSYFRSYEKAKSDLFMAPVEKVVWVNVYRRQSGSIITGKATYSSKSDAEDLSAHCEDLYLGAFPLTIKL